MTTTTKRQLIEQTKEIDNRLIKFTSDLMSEFPDLKLSFTGSVQYNSFELSMHKSVAKQILTKRHYQEFLMLTKGDKGN